MTPATGHHTIGNSGTDRETGLDERAELDEATPPVYIPGVTQLCLAICSNKVTYQNMRRRMANPSRLPIALEHPTSEHQRYPGARAIQALALLAKTKSQYIPHCDSRQASNALFPMVNPPVASVQCQTSTLRYQSQQESATLGSFLHFSPVKSRASFRLCCQADLKGQRCSVHAVVRGHLASIGETSLVKLEPSGMEQNVRSRKVNAWERNGRHRC